MDNRDNRVINLASRLKVVQERESADLASERIHNLAFQASTLPTTLSRSEIEELGLAVLTHMRRYERLS